MAPEFLTGVVEGFYGRPWSQQLRLEYAQILRQLGLNSYLYAPKADPFLRKQWQCDWPATEWRQLRELARYYAAAGLYFGVGLSPFLLYASYGAVERRQLQGKIERLNELEAPLLAVLFDDMPGDRADLAGRQAEIVADIGRWTTASRVMVCPTYYSFDPVLERHFGRRPASYWADLGRLLPVDVDLLWTGNEVCSRAILAQDVEQAREALGRPLVLWDNYPVNDGAVRSRHLYLEPLSQREACTSGALHGHFCNPMIQGWCSLPALLGLARLYPGKSEAADSLLSEILGAATWQQLQQDSGIFRDHGLDMPEAQRKQLEARYLALPGPAAAEVVRWLRGEDAFDPACLTD
ncbi:beta-N-acetylglucosaminidase domain-containing protein [Haliea sp. E1-2-M8]|uniref:beta-N-acetylglucosaminidase domain-containing protein n=1 Tax=Haliea sp. E1-2-M8 TaxID=3064706 RepID=UPI00272783A5|nr:beta-N-acetylglucosaminidase domain-containing protein [Haliea sp. E1-2-M8]MDO8862331.1 beta-N-acetylglucosaminidase domain-containing protein [Haliea sp. E1-2-M8]